MPDLPEADRVVKQCRKDKAILDKATEDLSEALARLKIKDSPDVRQALHALASLEGE